MEIKPDQPSPQWEPKFRALIESLPEPLSLESYQRIVQFIEELVHA